MLLGWIPEPELRDGYKPFVLAHPDLGIQNVLVAEDGTLQGIIDWDGICSVPRSIGNQRFPSWLSRDWDPFMYGRNEDMERGVEPLGVWEDSPETLKNIDPSIWDLCKHLPIPTTIRSWVLLATR